MYMSYCRYEGTLTELRACLNDVEEHINDEAECEVSDGEALCFKHIITEIYDWMNEQGLIDGYGELDMDSLDQICEAMKTVRLTETEE